MSSAPAYQEMPEIDLISLINFNFTLSTSGNQPNLNDAKAIVERISNKVQEGLVKNYKAEFVIENYTVNIGSIEVTFFNIKVKMNKILANAVGASAIFASLMSGAANYPDAREGLETFINDVVETSESLIASSSSLEGFSVVEIENSKTKPEEVLSHFFPAIRPED